jgi:hypothetical protein
LRSARHPPGAAVSFLITVLHTRADIDRCVEALRRSCAAIREGQSRRHHTLSRAGSGLLA